MNVSIRLLVGVVVAGSLCSPPVRGNVIAYALAGAGNSGGVNGWGGDVTGTGSSGAYAVARANYDQTSGTGSGGVFFDLTTLVCPTLCASDARATGNGITGAVSIFGGSGLYPTEGGTTINSVEMFDTITFNSPTATFNVDLFYSQFETSHPSVPPPFWDTMASLQAYFLLTTTDGDVLYVGAIDIHDSYTAGFGSRDYSICDGISFPCTEGTSFPVTNGHLGYTATFDATPFVGTPLSAYYRVRAETNCNYWVPSGDCTAIADSLHTSYIGIQGDFTSENGYQYLGVPAASAVPEPASHALIALVFAAGVTWRERRRESGRKKNAEQ